MSLFYDAGLALARIDRHHTELEELDVIPVLLWHGVRDGNVPVACEPIRLRPSRVAKPLSMRTRRTSLFR
jgi:hypothetical protein